MLLKSSGICLYLQVEHALFRALDIAMTRVQEIDPGEDVMQFISNRNTAANLMFDAMKARKDYLPSYWISESNGCSIFFENFAQQR